MRCAGFWSRLGHKTCWLGSAETPRVSFPGCPHMCPMQTVATTVKGAPHYLQLGSGGNHLVGVTHRGIFPCFLGGRAAKCTTVDVVAPAARWAPPGGS